MTNIETDMLSRNRIVSETDKNFFVEAGAGSGKTTMLVNRMVAMVEAGIDISKICAITFTKAAAGEFYDRFQKLLIERSNPEFNWIDKGQPGQLPKPTKESRELCAKALQNIDLCFMGTIDSFCSMVLSEHPSEAGIPSDAAIMSDEDAQNLYKQIYVKICAGEYGDRLKELAGNFRALNYDAEKKFIIGESIFMNNRNVHFNFNSSEVIDIDKAYAAEKASICRALKCLIEHPELAYMKNNDSVAAWEKINKTFTGINCRWSTNFLRVISSLKALTNLRVLPEAKDQYAPSLANSLEPGGKRGLWLEFPAAQKNGLLSKLHNMHYDVAMAFLSECVPVIEGAMRDKGAMTFFDYLYYLRNMLQKDAADGGKLIRYIYDRHSYFLIDEFQDTNPLQAEIFFYLSSEKPVEQWSSCVPRPGSLFIVGDPKQSIYRFRGADVTSFLKVKKLFADNGGDILYLSKNFRSTRKLICYFNDVFTKMLPAETEIQSRFEEIPLPDEKIEAFEGIYKYTAYAEKLAEEHPGESDPEQIKNIITRIVGQEKYRILADNGELRPICYSDIMVITVSKPKISGIMKALNQENIPLKVEGSVPFDRNDALIQIACLYRAVADTNDKAALFDALKGNLIGSCEEEMMKYRMAGGEISLISAPSLDEEAHPTAKKVAGYIEKIRKLAEKASGLSPAALFAEIMDSYEVYRFAPAENLEVLYYTLELLRNAEKTGLVVSLKDGADYLKNLISGAASEERCLSLSDAKDCVHIANLHKVKGLEAPVIILASAIKFENGATQRIVHGDSGSEGYIFSVSKREKDKTIQYFTTDRYPDEKETEDDALSAEHARLIYVGATRAKNVLIICDSIVTRQRSESHQSVWKDLLAPGCEDVFDATKDAEEPLKNSPEEIEALSLYQTAKENCVLNNRDAEKVSYQIENPSKARLSSKIADEETDLVVIPENEEGIDSGKSENSNAHRFPALLGTMTHRLMEIIVSSRNSYDTAQAINEIIREYQTPKNQPFETDLRKALKSVAQVMLHGGYSQENKAPQDLLTLLLRADEVHCEVPFCFKDEADGNITVWNGVMDVVYCESGKWHIIDYKTNAEGNRLDYKYKAQLEAYRKAFLATTGNDADAYIYHIDI